MDLDIAGRTALVVEGRSPLGTACAAALSGEGVTIVGDVEDRPDIVVAAAPDDRAGRVIDCDDVDQLESMWDSVERAVAVYRAAVPAMQERGWGRLIWVGSASSRSLDADDDELGGLATLAMRALGKVIRAEAGPAGVTANAVIVGGDATVEDVAATVAFLASTGAGYLTGVTLTVDGGSGSAVY